MAKRATSVFVVSALVVLALLSFAGPAAAGKPFSLKEHRIGFSCEEPWLSNEDGIAITAASISDVEGPSAIVLFWAPPETPETAEATYRSTTDVPEVTGDATHLDAVVPMEDVDFNPIGSATISADLAPVGEPEVSESFHQGNRLIRDRTTLQWLEVTAGTLTLPDGTTFDLTGCVGADLTIDIFITNPDATVSSHEGVLVVCDISTEDYSLGLAASSDETGTGGELFFSSSSGSFGGFGSDLTLTPETFSGTFELFDPETGDFAGEAVVDATLTQLRRIALDVSQEGQHSKITGWQLEVSGTITFPTDPATVVDLSSCFAVDGTQHTVEPHPGKPVPEE